MRAHGAQREKIVEPPPRADRRAPGHQHLAAGVEQLFGDDEIVGHVRKNLETVVAEDARGFDQSEHVGRQQILLADDFELDPAGREEFARHLRRGDRLLHRSASRGIGQHAQVLRADQLPEAFAGAAPARFAAQRDRDDFRRRSPERLAKNGRRRILRRADEKPRLQRDAVKLQRIVQSSLQITLPAEA